MWLFTLDGFYSVRNVTDQPEQVMVRTRDREDLQRLLRRLQIRRKIHVGVGTDYEFRAIVPVAEWLRYQAMATVDIEYSNFKNAIAQHLGPERSDIYHRVWVALLALEKERPDLSWAPTMEKQ